MEQDIESDRSSKLVQALPPKLYNCILDLTFTANYETRRIHEDYRPPACIQVSCSTRKTFAESYYNRTIFYATYHDCRAWIKDLSRSHVRSLKEIRIIDSHVHKSDVSSRPDFLKHFSEAYYKMILPHGPSEKPCYKDMSAISGAVVFKFRTVDDASGVQRWLSLHDAHAEYIDLSAWVNN